MIKFRVHRRFRKRPRNLILVLLILYDVIWFDVHRKQCHYFIKHMWKHSWTMHMYCTCSSFLVFFVLFELPLFYFFTPPPPPPPPMFSVWWSVILFSRLLLRTAVCLRIVMFSNSSVVEILFTGILFPSFPTVAISACCRIQPLYPHANTHHPRSRFHSQPCLWQNEPEEHIHFWTVHTYREKVQLVERNRGWRVYIYLCWC